MTESLAAPVEDAVDTPGAGGKGGNVFASRKGALAKFLAVRFLLIIPTVWILVTVVFFVMRIAGDPISAKLGGILPPEQIAERRHAAGLDKPILTQYWDYISGLLTGDLGRANADGEAISHVIVVYGAATLELVFWSLIVAFLVGIPLGRFAATHRDRLSDVSLRMLAILFYAAPVFFVGMLFKLIFSAELGWLPSNGRADVSTELDLQNVSPETHIYIIDAILYGDPHGIADVLAHAVLPALALGLMTAGVFLRLVRVNLLQTLRSGYVEAARARGVPERTVVGRHAFRNALVPVVTVIGMQIAMMLGGAVLTETTFEWKGLGYQLARYLQDSDYIAVQGIVAFIAVVIALISFVIDAIVALIDPRIRF
ncbi:ABC transporter permease [Williamsia sterculiae]|uniref:Peptide/nickel transport system permease protein n=1 Tax=Williamsia sterculiae TaxID=1344003 RepID=A0A1N7GXK8_9NOCA|nr:ABC transporter permease [Williamsia sterculiae]SIS17280.1 peptide/nickel transport system permease protein [Williamsia sterculiae]